MAYFYKSANFNRETEVGEDGKPSNMPMSVSGNGFENSSFEKEQWSKFIWMKINPVDNNRDSMRILKFNTFSLPQ